MNVEYGQKIIKRRLTEHANRPYIPMSQQIEESGATLERQLQEEVPEVQEILHERNLEEREIFYKWKERSNTTIPGEPYTLDDLHKMMNALPIYSKHYGGRIYDGLDGLIDLERDGYWKSVGGKPSKPGWGWYNNLTWDQYEPRVKRLVVDWINSQFETARIEDSKSKQPHPKHLFPENEDTKP